MQHLIYDILDASYNYNENRHAAYVMKKLGITYQVGTPQSMMDCWWFWNCENVPENPPSFIKPLTRDPMDCIGYGLSKETAEKIKNYKK